MNDTIRKRHETRVAYAAALASWRTPSSAGTCPACHNARTVQFEDGSLPCPYCRPDEAREAARGATP